MYFWKIKVFQDVVPHQLANTDQSTLFSVLEGLSIQQHCCKNLSLTFFFLQDLHLFLQNTSTFFQRVSVSLCLPFIHIGMQFHSHQPRWKQFVQECSQV